MANPDSGWVIFRRRSPSARSLREDFKCGRHTGNVSARSHSNTVVPSVTLPVLVLHLRAYFRKTCESVDDDYVESARKRTWRSKFIRK